MLEPLKESLVKACYKIVVWFVLFNITDYFFDLTIIDQFVELGLVSWIILYIVFVISNLIKLKYKKN